jgi:hypothetical protein
VGVFTANAAGPGGDSHQPADCLFAICEWPAIIQKKKTYLRMRLAKDFPAVRLSVKQLVSLNHFGKYAEGLYAHPLAVNRSPDRGRFRSGAGNTLLRRGPSSLRADSSQARAPADRRPLGTSTAITDQEFIQRLPSKDLQTSRIVA